MASGVSGLMQFTRAVRFSLRRQVPMQADIPVLGHRECKALHSTPHLTRSHRLKSLGLVLLKRRVNPIRFGLEMHWNALQAHR